MTETTNYFDQSEEYFSDQKVDTAKTKQGKKYDPSQIKPNENFYSKNRSYVRIIGYVDK